MKQKNLLLVGLLFFCTSTFGQNISFDWAKSFQGTSIFKKVSGIVTDTAGNVYTVGLFRDTVDFDPGTGVFNLSTTGLENIFISKLDANGDFVWAKQIEGQNAVKLVHSVTLDSDGNIVFVGSITQTADFDPGSGVFNLTSAGIYDGFICKLNMNGNFIWAKLVGGSGIDQIYGLVTDDNSNIYYAGYYYNSADFDPGPASFPLVSKGLSDIVVGKLDSAGSFVWAKSMGGNSVELAHDIDIDHAGNIYTTGYFNDTVDFDPGASTANLISSGGKSVFVNKLDTNGQYIWAKTFTGGNLDKIGNALAVDAQGSVYTVGHFAGTIDFDPSSTVDTVTSNGGNDFFISKLDANGNYIWSKSYGGPSDDKAYDLDLNSTSNITVAGYFNDTVDFTPSNSISLLKNSNGGSDMFITTLDTSGQHIQSIAMGGTGDDEINAIAYNGEQNLYTSGLFIGTVDFNPESSMIDNLQSITAGAQDIFVQKFKIGAPLGVIDETPAMVKDIIIYPNPAQNVIQIKSNSIPIKSIEIINVDGKIIRAFGRGENTLDISELNAGIYFIKCKTEKGNCYQKLLKK